MREAKRMAWAAALALVAGSSAWAQQGGGTGGGIGNASGQAAGLPSSTTGGGGTMTTGGTSSTGSSTTGTNGIPGASSTPQSNYTLASPLTPPSKALANNSTISASNFLRGYFGAPYYQGVYPGSNGPGGFGVATYPASGTATNARGGGGGISSNKPGGIFAPLPRQIAYAAQVRFKVPGANAMPQQLQSAILGDIGRLSTDQLANPAAVKVDVNGRNVFLRGTVRDQDEALLLEGMVRLTPGVRGITNELTYPK